VNIPETRYARAATSRSRTRCSGTGPFDLVRIPPYVSHVELAWQIPSLAAFNRELASLSRLITFDKRGTGMSDRVSGAPSLEVRMDDVRAVMDATRFEQAALLGVSEGRPMSILFAATYPERVWALVLDGATPRSLWASDYRWGLSEDDWLHRLDTRGRLWGTPEHVASSVELGIEIRAGLHTGECERIDNKVGGIAVNIGARVASKAGAGEVLVSSTVKDLVAGSGIAFVARGVAELKGVPGEWRLFAVESASP